MTILHAEGIGAWEESLCSLANFMGVPAVHLRLAEAGSGAEEFLRVLSKAGAVAMSAETLAAIEKLGLVPADFARLGDSPLKGVLVYGYRASAHHAELAKRWSDGAVRAMEPLQGATRCSFPGTGKAHARQLAGCEFNRAPATADCCFDVVAGSNVETLMELAARPVFIRTNRCGAPWFHWAGGDSIADPNESIHEDTLMRRCERLVPPIMFLRAAFPNACWENPVRTARVIIDDPLLRESYGFLNYHDLFKSQARLRYGVTTAFIPWNYRRTSRKAARVFSEHHPSHSICVHGCDHSNNEFGVTDENLLDRKSQASVARMENHERQTGIPWDRVMVFPQGKFTTVAMRAVRHAGFLAVVNSTRIAANHNGSDSSLGEELLPATNRYAGLPIFARRDPTQMTAYALDLFLGKPVHVVEHHDWFAKGCDDLEECVRFLKKIEPALAWPSLAESLPRQHLRRQGGDGKCHVRFFTSQFEFESPDSRARSFLFTRPEPEECRVKSVRVGGAEVPFTHRDGFVEFECELGPKQRVSMRLHDSAPNESAWTPGLKYRAMIHVRRKLSEFRDNHLVKHPALLRSAIQGVRRLKWSTDGRHPNGVHREEKT